MKQRILALGLTMAVLMGLLSTGVLAEDIVSAGTAAEPGFSEPAEPSAATEPVEESASVEEAEPETGIASVGDPETAEAEANEGSADTYAGLEDIPVASGEEDPMYWSEMRRQQTATDDVTGEASVKYSAGPASYEDCYPREVDGETIRKGIDVSQYQGDIDWKAVAESGVEFAIIRVAARGWGVSGTLMRDADFEENLREARANGILVGAYIFSQAITVEEGIEEAKHLMKLIQGYTIDLPLVIDFEYASGSSGETGRLYHANLSRAEHTAICNAFCDTVEAAGYASMVYANRNMLENHMNAGELDRVWLANYTTQTWYKGDYEYWQFSSNGRIDGITSNTVDLDFWFDPSGTPGNDLPFRDVNVGQWFYDSVAWAHANGIVKGITATSFEPDTKAFRGHVITMLYRMEGEPAVSGTSSFIDLTADYYQDAILWAEQNQISNGTSATTFSPEDEIRRADLVTLLWRIYGEPESSLDLSSYKDAQDVEGYAAEAMAWAVESGIIRGYGDNTLRPHRSTSRAEVCAILMRYQEV